MNTKDIETLRNLADIFKQIKVSVRADELRAIADSMEKVEPVGEIATEPFGDGGKGICILKWRDHYIPKLGDKLYTHPPRAEVLKDVEVSLGALRGISNHLEAIALYFPVGHSYRNTLLWCREELLRLKELQDGFNADRDLS